MASLRSSIGAFIRTSAYGGPLRAIQWSLLPTWCSRHGLESFIRRVQREYQITEAFAAIVGTDGMHEVHRLHEGNHFEAVTSATEFDEYGPTGALRLSIPSSVSLRRLILVPWNRDCEPTGFCHDSAKNVFYATSVHPTLQSAEEWVKDYLVYMRYRTIAR